MCPPTETDTPTASESEVSRYEKAFLATRRVLDEAIRSLSILQELATDPDRQDALGEKLVELEGERNDLARANIAFHAEKATMVPPSPALVSDLTALANEATLLTQQKATAAAILKLATKALNKFAEVQDI
jgi:hypothetical protein